MVWLWLVGRVVFGLYFISAGVNHFTKYQGMKQYTGYKKIPAPGLAVIVSGLLLIGGGLSIVTGCLIQPALIVLAIFLLIAAIQMHNFWTLDDANAKMGEMNQFLKNIAIAAACLMMLAITNWSWRI